MSKLASPLASDVAMVLAAGIGKRMRPLTATRPKPLVRVDGRPLIDHSLDKLVEAGVSRAVVNVHYLPGQIEAHLAQRSAPQIADEVAQLGAFLGTGSGADGIGAKRAIDSASSLRTACRVSSSVARRRALWAVPIMRASDCEISSPRPDPPN